MVVKPSLAEKPAQLRGEPAVGRVVPLARTAKDAYVLNVGHNGRFLPGTDLLDSAGSRRKVACMARVLLIGVAGLIVIAVALWLNGSFDRSDGGSVAEAPIRAAEESREGTEVAASGDPAPAAETGERVQAAAVGPRPNADPGVAPSQTAADPDPDATGSPTVPSEPADGNPAPGTCRRRPPYGSMS